MSMLKGSQTFTRFRITQDLPPDWRERLEHRAHQPRPDARTKEPYGGWVSIDDETRAPVDVIFGDAYAFSCRIDKKRVPARALKLAIEARQREVMHERGLERLGKNHRQEIAEAVEEDLLGQALPSIEVVDILVSGGVAWVFTASAAVCDFIQASWFDTFGVRLYPERLSDWLSESIGWDSAEVMCRRLPGGSASMGRASEPNPDGWHENDPMSGREFQTASGFLAHLVAQGSEDGADVWLDSKVQFDAPSEDGGKSRMVLDGTINEAGMDAAGAAGQRPVLGRFGWRHAEVETVATLKAEGSGFVYKSAKLPIAVKDGLEEMVLERVFLLERWHASVREAFVEWFAKEGEEPAEPVTFSRPGTTPKAQATWTVPAWLPDMGEGWGAWECSGGEWWAGLIGGERTEVRVGDPEMENNRKGVDAFVTHGDLYVGDHVKPYAAGIPRLLEMMRFCGLEPKSAEVEREV